MGRVCLPSSPLALAEQGSFGALPDEDQGDSDSAMVAEQDVVGTPLQDDRGLVEAPAGPSMPHHQVQPESGGSCGPALCLPSGRQPLNPPLPGLSQDAQELVNLHIRKSTRQCYDPRFRIFMDYCSAHGSDPYTATPTVVTNFLAHVRRERRDVHGRKSGSYSTVCGFRSAIAKYHLGHQGVSISEHPMIKSVIKGVGHEAPPLAKYTRTWPLDSLLHHVAEFPPLEFLSLKHVQQKLLVLLVVRGCLR